MKSNSTRFRDSEFNAPVMCTGHPVVKHCVLVATDSQGIAVRDSKDSTRATLHFSHEEWAIFVESEVSRRKKS